MKNRIPTKFYNFFSFFSSEQKLKGITRPTDIDDVLFDLLSDKEDKVSVNKFWNVRELCVSRL